MPEVPHRGFVGESPLTSMLVNLYCDDPLDEEDVQEYIEELAEKSALSEKQAEYLVRQFGQGMATVTIAEEMEVSRQRVTALKNQTQEKLVAVDRTSQLVHDLRDDVQPDPTD